MAEEPFFSNRLPVTATPKPEGVEKILPVPVSGKVVKGFGMIIDPLDNMERFHCGIDIAASVGAAVKAVQDGKVKQLGNDPVLGRFILPEHIPGDFSFMAVCRLQWLKQGRPSRPGRLLPRQGG